MNGKSLIGGLLAGAVVGVAVGLLLAPDSGTKTRDLLIKGSRKLTDNLKGSAKDSIQFLKDSFNSVLDEVATKAKDTITIAKDQAKI
jgi:gas vesicle protein